MKKLCALLLSLSLTITCFALPAAAEGFPYQFENSSPHCESILMVNADTDTVVYSYNPDEKRAIASLTKIMTYIVAYENIPDIENQLITVPESVEEDLEGTGSSLAYLQTGEQFTGLQLLNLMMVPSGNDAALTLAKYVDSLGLTRPAGDIAADGTVGGDTESEPGSTVDSAAGTDSAAEIPVTFVDLMNLKAQELGCKDTHFMNPHGLHEEEHYSTARDMIKIAEYARGLPHFAEITSQTVYEQPATNMNSENRYVYSTNRLLLQNQDPDYYYRYATGIKTGSLDESGYCLVSSAVLDGYTYLIAALGSPYIDANGDHISEQGEMLDSRELYRWAFTQLSLKTVAGSGQLMADTQLNYAWRKNRIQLVAGKDISVILPKDVETSSLITALDIPESIDAPVKKGDVVGTATLSYADEVVATVPLVAAESVERSEVMLTLQQGKAVFTSPWFLVLAGGIVLLILIYILLMILHNRSKKRQKNVRRYRDM